MGTPPLYKAPEVKAPEVKCNPRIEVSVVTATRLIPSTVVQTRTRALPTTVYSEITQTQRNSSRVTSKVLSIGVSI